MDVRKTSRPLAILDHFFAFEMLDREASEGPVILVTVG